MKVIGFMKYLFANWKMYLSVDESIALAKKAASFSITKDKKLVLFPSALAFTDVKKAVGKKLEIGAQDGHWEKSGAETGDVSMHDLKAEGAEYVLIGHSERRADGDTDEIVARKMQSAVGAGLKPVLCVGETKEDLNTVGRDERLRSQLTSALKNVVVKELFIAYEPVWAIGTGDDDNPKDVAEARDIIEKVTIVISPATKPIILYGGSVEAKNVGGYTEIMDGVLVGGASAKVGSLRGILREM